MSTFLITGATFVFFFLFLISGLSPFLSPYLPWFLVIFSFPHFMATYWVWGCRVKSWANEKWALVFPFFYLGIFILSSQGWLGPVEPGHIIKLSYFYLLYHFAQQLYGATLWMSYEHGVHFKLWEKRVLRTFFLVTAAYAILDLELKGAASSLFYYPTWNWTFPSELIMATFSVSFGLFFFLSGKLLLRYLKEKNKYLLASLSSLLVAWIWFLPPFNQSIILFLPILHAIQYSPFIKLKGQRLKSWQWGFGIVVFMATGWIFFRWLPFFASQNFLEQRYWSPMVLTLLNNHHFVIDGRIWKLKDPANKDLFASAPS